MSVHHAKIEWQRNGMSFELSKYSGSHRIEFEHHKSHDKCFIANSVKTEVLIEPR